MKSRRLCHMTYFNQSERSSGGGRLLCHVLQCNGATNLKEDLFSDDSEVVSEVALYSRGPLDQLSECRVRQRVVEVYQTFCTARQRWELP